MRCTNLKFKCMSYLTTYSVLILLFLEVPCCWFPQLNWITQVDPAKCPNKCGKSYKGPHRKHNLRQHLVYECGVAPKFQCRICFKRFSRNHHLKFHLMRIHKIIN